MTIILTLALILIGLAGFSAYAAGSAPGHVLYSFKVRVNEQFLSLFMRSARAEAEWALVRAERRFLEAERQLRQDALTEQAAFEIAGHLHDHIARANLVAEELESQGQFGESAALLANLEVLLRTHSAILTDMAHGKETAQLAAEVQRELEQVAYNRKNAETEVLLHSDIQSLAREEGLRVQEEMRHTSGPEVEQARVLLEEGEAALEEQAYAEAFFTFQRAQRFLKSIEAQRRE